MCHKPQQPGIVNLQGIEFSPFRENCCNGSSYSQALQGLQLRLELLSVPLCPVQKEERYQLVRDGTRLPARQKDFKMLERAHWARAFVSQVTEQFNG